MLNFLRLSLLKTPYGHLNVTCQSIFSGKFPFVSLLLFFTISKIACVHEEEKFRRLMNYLSNIKGQKARGLSIQNRSPNFMHL